VVNLTQKQSNNEILLVEDDLDIRESLIYFLESEGFSIVSKSNGKEALEYLTSGNAVPALMLLDLMMPVMSGYELLAALTAMPRNDVKAMPTVLLSASNDIQSVAEAYGTRYIKKPIHLEQLLEVLTPYRQSP